MTSFSRCFSNGEICGDLMMNIHDVICSGIDVPYDEKSIRSSGTGI